MNDKKNTGGIQAHDILAAFSLLTRLPVPVQHSRAGLRAGAAVWAYPLVGGFVGLLSGASGMFALWLGVDQAMAAILVVTIAALLTGALHEDALADCADGLAGGQSVARRLEIMKDSRLGAFGVTALVLVLGARWSGIQALLDTPLPVFVVIGAASRLPMVLAMSLLPLAQNKGMAANAGHPPLANAALAVGICLAICLVLLGSTGFTLLFAACLAPLPLWFAARRLIGGYTGDILGGSQQLAEVAALAVATAILG